MDPRLVSAFFIIGSTKLYMEVENQVTVSIFRLSSRNAFGTPQDIERTVCPLYPQYMVPTEPDGGISPVRKLRIISDEGWKTRTCAIESALLAISSSSQAL